MKTKVINIQDKKALSIATEVLNNFGVVAFPTDTVYGLATLAFNSSMINKLFTIKERSVQKAIAILIGNPNDLPLVSKDIGEIGLSLAKKFWPGPLTLVVSKHQNVSDNISPLPTIGVRIPDYPFAIDLLNIVGPLAVTSANLSNGENPKTAQDVLNMLDGKIDLLIDGGKTKGGAPSTVLDLTKTPFEIVRQGPISTSDISSFLK